MERKKKRTQQSDTQVKKENKQKGVATKKGQVGGAANWFPQQIDRMVDVMETSNTSISNMRVKVHKCTITLAFPKIKNPVTMT